MRWYKNLLVCTINALPAEEVSLVGDKSFMQVRLGEWPLGLTSHTGIGCGHAYPRQGYFCVAESQRWLSVFRSATTKGEIC